MEGFYIVLASTINVQLFAALGIQTLLQDNGQFMVARMTAEEVDRATHRPMESPASWKSPIMPYDERITA